jgi:uncharacterized membrane protein YbhN (UPF0104 family)
VEAFRHAVEVFFDRLAAVHWQALAVAIGFHLLKPIAVSRAWRNIIADAYPASRVSWLGIFGAYLAGVGVNAIVPARGGEALKIFLARRHVAGSTYTTLASTLVLLTAFDFIVSFCLFLWALTLGVLPGIDVLPRLPAFDTGWFLDHPRLTGIVVAALLGAGLLATAWAWSRFRTFKQRVSMGFTIVRDRPRYLRKVAFWQAIDWTLRLLAIYWFLRAFGLTANLHNAVLVEVTQNVSGLFPFSPSGIGTEQALLVYVFRGQFPAGALLSFSVGVRFTLVVTNLALGFLAIAVMMRTLRWRRAIEARPEAARP